MIQVDIANQQTMVPLDHRRLRSATHCILEGEGFPRASVSLAFVDDPTIHQLNRQHLGHDRPTDVLSFLLEQEGDYLEGEVIVSAETALLSAPRYGWTAADELLLYVIHGLLHLVGYDDHTADQRRRMRARERRYLGRFNLHPQYRGRPRSA